ncbi:MAG: lamin tail domain-containing protein [Candidatus Limnocylindria bacterium]
MLAAAAAGIVMVGALLPVASTRAEGAEHLVISEIATGGAGASDEFIELFNPGTVDLPLAGLEVAYASASGATVSQRATWAADAPAVPPGEHLLLANAAGTHAASADVLYQGGLAEAGGTVILRWLGAATAIDAVAWGTGAGAWIEGAAAPAPPPGSSLERLTSAPDGRMQDTDDNASDFVVQPVPSPQAAGALTPAPPTPTPAPTPAATAAASPAPTPAPTATPGPTPVSIAAARALANGTPVTIEATALTGSTFSDGGGHLADDSGGIAVIVEDGSFNGGSRLVVSGTLDDRFAQRTIRARAADVRVLGPGSAPQPTIVTTGSIGEATEGRLVRLPATVRAAPTALSAALAFEVDDGSGAARVVVGSATGVDTASWATGATIEIVGIVGQRDSSGTGTSGYRVQPRSQADVLRVVAPPPDPSPSATASATPAPSPAATAVPASVTPIATARSAAAGTRHTLRGVVTLAPGVVDAETAVIQDETGAIVVRVDAQTAPLREGDVIEVDGVRSTKSGMETLRASSAARVVGSGQPGPIAVVAADVSEGIEARLVTLAGQLVGSARRAASGTVSFDLADGTGVVRVILAAALQADDSALVAGAEVEVVGVVGQETTAAEPLVGYRIWPRAPSEVRIVGSPRVEPDAPAGPVEPRTGDVSERGATIGPTATSDRTLESVGIVGLGDLRVGATLVIAGWPELGIGGLLWDGSRLVAVSADSASGLAGLGVRRPPVPLVLNGLRLIGIEPSSSVPIVALGPDAGDLTVGASLPAAPRAAVPGAGEPPAWVTLVGRVVTGDGALEVGEMRVALDIRCASPLHVSDGVLSVTGIGLADPARVIVPCDGIRAAPMLGRAVLAPSRATEPRAAPAERDDPDVSSGPDRRRTLAAWLLALGVLVVGGATLTWRRLAAVADADPAEDEGPVAEIPQLALVGLRREGGS